MKPVRRDNLYLQDMLTSMNRILDYIGNADYEEFKENFMMVDAVVRNFEIIGEAAGKVSRSIQNKHPEIPWKKMYCLRNLVIHEYFGIDHEMIWGNSEKQPSSKYGRFEKDCPR
jgi:uncharacterized protein with HEPN domain